MKSNNRSASEEPTAGAALTLGLADFGKAFALHGADFAAGAVAVFNAELALSRACLGRSLILVCGLVVLAFWSVGLIIVGAGYVVAVPMGLGWGGGLAVMNLLVLALLGLAAVGALRYTRQAGFERTKALLRTALQEE